MTITENSDLDSEISKIDSFLQSLNSINSTYLSALNEAKGLLDSASFSDWEDEVSSKMQVMVNDYKINCLDVINSDLSSGGFFTLKNKTKDLLQALKECKIAFNNRLNAKKKLDNTPKQIKIKVEDSNNTHWRQDSGYGYHYEWVDNPDYSVALSAYNAAVEEHKRLIKICNNLILEISNIDFRSQYSQTEGLGTVTEMPEFTAESNGALTADSSLGENIYKGYYEFVDSDGNKHVYDVLINGDNGNIIYGTADEGYIVVCRSANGTDIHGGTAVGSGDGSPITNYVNLIKDGHENSTGSNSFAGISPHSSYGYDNTISPMPLSNLIGNVSRIPITLGGNVVYVDVPSFDEGIRSYLDNYN